MSTTNPTWIHERPFRNFNPLDLRPRSHVPPWPGQVGLDTAPAGPFAIFASIPDGWCSGGLWLMMAHDLWGLTTVKAMIGTFAPWIENNTAAYTETVCKPLGITETTPVDPHDRVLRRALMKAMAHVEDYKVQWDDAALDQGNLLVDARWPAFRVAYLAGQAQTPRAPAPTLPPHVAPYPHEMTADELMAREDAGETFPIKGDQT